MFQDAHVSASATVGNEGDNMEDDDQRALFRELYIRSEARIASLFGGQGTQDNDEPEDGGTESAQLAIEARSNPIPQIPAKKPARTIVEDDYDDDDDDDDDENNVSPLKKSAATLLSPSKSGSSPQQPDLSPTTKQLDKEKSDGPQVQTKTSEDARKQLEESKKATGDAVKRSFSSMFWLLDSDKIAMQEQQKLEESEKQIDAEMDRNQATNAQHHGTLSSANLGASSLTLKHLIARIDLKRHQVAASDAELRSLMNEVRKNRSKWASEENVGQEELYEAAEKVLSELKAMTEYSAPFLTRVNKREAPDYYNGMNIYPILQLSLN
jgi:transcriptional activator SPT7